MVIESILSAFATFTPKDVLDIFLIFLLIYYLLLLIKGTKSYQMAMGLLFSFTATWWVLPISVLALVGYFFFPGIFFLWMGVLVGGTMIALGLYIHARW